MQNENIQEIFTDKIDDPVVAMRTDLNRDALFELADNIRINGLINPITVRPVGDRFEVVAGHRRLSACKIAGKIKIQCVVRELTDKEVFAVKAAENLERSDVDPVDEATFISQYINETGATPAEVAKTLRRSIQYVETRLAIGTMPDYMKGYLKRGELKLGAALALNEITDEKIRYLWTEMGARDGVSVAQAEYWVQGWKMNSLPGAIVSETPPDGYQPGVAQVLKFECALDGKEYDARLFKTFMVYEGNLPVLEAIVKEFRSLPAGIDNPPAENAEG